MTKFSAILPAAALIAFAGTSAHASGINLAINGDFETGNTSGWTSFPTPNSTFAAISDNPSSGSFAGEIFNDDAASAAIIKQANLGIGQVFAGQEVTITFDGRGSDGAGGVQFAEFFSELSGGGTSKAEILGGAPLFLGSDWATYSFTTTLGPDVSGGVTLQFTATTGGAVGSFAQTVIDNVSIEIIPTPSAYSILGLGLAAIGARRRRHA